MNTMILTLLRHDARSWWFHTQLRRQGEIGAARGAERASIRASLRSLRISRDKIRPVVEHVHRTKYVEFERMDGPLCVSGVHPGEWAAYHVIHGWMGCFEPVPNLGKWRNR